MRLLFALALVLSSLVGPSARATPVRRCSTSASPVGTGACPGVRPGAFFRSPVGGCSFNFLFRGSDGERYIGSAGHCLLEADGERGWGLGAGPIITDSAGTNVGRGAFAILGGDRDFSLIRLNRGVSASPQMCHFGGPIGIDETFSSSPVTLEHYGNGLAVSNIVPARTAIAPNTRNRNEVSVIGVANLGDSGSGATLDGRAFGVVVALGVGNSGYIFITRIPSQVEIAEDVLHIKLKLETAPRL